MDRLEKLKDRYTPAEIVEKLEGEPWFEDVFYECLGDYIEMSINLFEEDFDYE